MSITVHFMFNMRPHYHRATFDCPYNEVTLGQLLQAAHDAHAKHLLEEPGADLSLYRLRLIEDEVRAGSLRRIIEPTLRCVKRRKTPLRSPNGTVAMATQLSRLSLLRTSGTKGAATTSVRLRWIRGVVYERLLLTCPLTSMWRPRRFLGWFDFMS